MTNMPRVRLRVKDVNIEVKPTLTIKEVENFVAFFLGYAPIFMNELVNEDELSSLLNWGLRLATVALYTDYPIDASDMEELANFLYGTPLYAMLVGSPEHPVQYNGKTYTKPMIDIEQFDNLVDGLNLILKKAFTLVER